MLAFLLPLSLRGSDLQALLPRWGSFHLGNPIEESGEQPCHYHPSADKWRSAESEQEQQGKQEQDQHHLQLQRQMQILTFRT